MTVDMRSRLDDFGRRLEVLENELAELGSGLGPQLVRSRSEPGDPGRHVENP